MKHAHAVHPPPRRGGASRIESGQVEEQDFRGERVIDADGRLVLDLRRIALRECCAFTCALPRTMCT